MTAVGCLLMVDAQSCEENGAKLLVRQEFDRKSIENGVDTETFHLGFTKD